MLRPFWSVCLSLLVLVTLGARVQAEPEAHWVWYDDGKKTADAPADRAWFRCEFKAEHPSSGAVMVASDGAFTLWVNGRKIGSGDGEKLYRFSLSGIVERGTNVFAVESKHAKGPAGIYVLGEIRAQTGSKLPCFSNTEWKATRTPPTGDLWLKPSFAATGWTFVKDLGAHQESPWKSLKINREDLDRFDVPQGFEVTRIATKDLAGSVVAMTWGNRGRLIVAREPGKDEIGRIMALVDDNGDGIYDRSIQVTDKVHTCQGLCQIGDDLYVVGATGKGKSAYAGVFRLRDANHDDVADSVETLVKHKGSVAEHGPHAVTLGPDGWLYHVIGNHAWITNKPESTSPVRDYTEGNLFEPRFEDAGGHAVGIKAPGGTIWRFTPDGKKWWLETDGFRNSYDIGFSQRGNLFSFDSDMEWDVGLSWYRPVRVNFCPPGAELGWRSGAATWPDYYFDSLPASVNVGRGSPTGVIFYDHSQFPEKYRGSFLCCDWSMGRILACPLQPDSKGAGYSGTFENLVTGNPLNVSDIEVDRDGSIVFCTGGRRTEGGVYRLSYAGTGTQSPASPKAKVTAPTTIRELIASPQPQAAWNREAAAALKAKLGKAWETELLAVVTNGGALEKIRALTLLSQQGPQPSETTLIAAARGPHASVRQFATWLLGNHKSPEVAAALAQLLDDSDPIVKRRACEAFVRSGLEAPVAKVVTLLGHEDRWLRFAARLTLERIPADKWKLISPDAKPTAQVTWLLARQRAVPQESSLKASLPVVQSILQTEQGTTREVLDAVRLTQLAILADKSNSQSKSDVDLQPLKKLLKSRFDALLKQPAKTDGEFALPLRQEISKLLAYLDVPETVPSLVKALERAETPAEQVHYVLCLSQTKSGWTPAARTALVRWYEKTGGWEGGNSLQGYIRNILGGVTYEVAGKSARVTGCLDHFDPAERKKYLLSWKQNPLTARVIISNSNPDQVADYVDVTNKLIGEVEAADAGGSSQQELVVQIIDALGKSPAESAQAILRKLFDSHSDLQNQIGRNLAKHPTAENVPYLQKVLRSGDATAMQITLDALASSSYKPANQEESKNADEYRQVLLAGLKLGNQGGIAAVRLLEKWTGNKRPAGTEKDVPKALAHYKEWYSEKFPDALPAELPPASTNNAKFSLQQIVDYLEKDARGRQGNVERGKSLFTKVNCVKCHKFGAEGTGVGPDLTTVRRRFQRKEIVESILYPSQVVSDQYRSVQVTTKKGLQHNGLKLSGGEKLTLLLSDGSRMEIPGTDIEEQTPSKTSVMPEGLLKELSLQQIADLFAYIEISKNAVEPAATPPTSQKTAASGTKK